jgi:tetratricopeptide (TPR) repeat protein
MVIAALIALIPFFWEVFKKKPPRFALNDTYFRPDANILIFPENSSAQKRQPLDVRFDGYDFNGAGELVQDSDEIQWRFALQRHGHPPRLAEDGPHKMLFGFAGVFSDSALVHFDSKAPQTRVGFSGDASGNKTFYGEVIDDAGNEEKNIFVEMAFKHQEQLQTIQVPVRKITDAYGQTRFEFEYQVQNLPRYQKDDPNYKALYFRLMVRDEAGNVYHQASTYNAFIAEGEQVFGFESGQIIMQKIAGDTPGWRVAAAPPKIIDLPLERNLAAGEPLIILRVVISTRTMIKLSWNRLPDELRPAQEEYTILRENKPIATSFDTTFTDTAPSAAKTQYQVLARGNDNRFYPSTPATAGTDTLSLRQAKLLFFNLPSNWFISHRQLRPTGGFSVSFTIKNSEIPGDTIDATPFLNALNIQPNHFDINHMLGTVYYFNGKIDLAETYYQRALDLDRNRAEIHNDLSLIHFHRKDFFKALENLNQAITLNPKFPEAYFNRAIVLEAMGEKQLALVAWKDYLDLRDRDKSEWQSEALEHLSKLSE